MPIDPLIARGAQVGSPAQTLGQIAALRQRDMALAQDQQAFQLNQQKLQREIALQEKADQLWDEGLADLNSPDPMRQKIAAVKLARADGPAATALLKSLGLDGGDDSEIYGKINPGDFTPASLAAHAATVTPQNPRGDLGVLVKNPFAPPAPILVNTPGAGAFLTSRGGPTGPAGSTIQTFSTPEQEEAARVRTAGGEAGAKTIATTQAEAAANLPKAEYSADQIINTIENLANHPGTRFLYGKYALSPIVPGTEQAGAGSYLTQVRDQAFLQAFESIKGAGAITEKEGEKATGALTRLQDRKISYEDAQKAMIEFTTQVRKGVALARRRAGQPARPGQSSAPGAAAAPDDPFGLR